jgi:hypothetical protein
MSSTNNLTLNIMMVPTGGAGEVNLDYGGRATRNIKFHRVDAVEGGALLPLNMDGATLMPLNIKVIINPTTVSNHVIVMGSLGQELFKVAFAPIGATLIQPPLVYLVLSEQWSWNGMVTFYGSSK